jgi:hypothetical protein
MTAAEIVVALSRLDPPIMTSIRTVERDITTVRDSGRRYLTRSTSTRGSRSARRSRDSN